MKTSLLKIPQVPLLLTITMLALTCTFQACTNAQLREMNKLLMGTLPKKTEQ